jgi:CelD/BcsL family acetyltransferase involved in cellulose biosynthesis
VRRPFPAVKVNWEECLRAGPACACGRGELAPAAEPESEDVVTIELIDNSARFEALQADWTGLLEASSAESPFVTWEWLNAWWTHLRGSRRLAILAVRSGSQLIAIAPLAASGRRLPFFRRLEFLGTGSAGSDYLDAIVRRGCEADAVQALAGYLQSQNTALHLDHLPPNALLSRLTAPLTESGWAVRQVSYGVCPFIRLSGHSWDSFRVSSRRRLRSLQKKFSMRFECVADDAMRQAALAKLFAFHQARWGARGTAFQTDALRAFHLDVTARARNAGWLRLYTLHLDEDLAAVMYGFSFKGRFYFYQHGYDARYQPYSLGRAVVDLSIRAAIDEGLSEFDLLNGNEAYKSAWTGDTRSLSQIDLFPAHLGGRIHQRTVDTERTLRAFARRVLSPNVQHAS